MSGVLAITEAAASMLGYKMVMGGVPVKGAVTTALAAGLITPSLVYDLYSFHFDQFKQEYVRLYKSVKKSRSDPRINKLLKGHEKNYLIVNRNGKLVPKPSERGTFFRPFGRRRIPNPLNKKISSARLKKMEKPMQRRKLHW